MSVYRVTRFNIVNIASEVEATQAMRNLIESTSAEFVDIVSARRGSSRVIARYPDSATMEAATSAARQVFGRQTGDSIIDDTSLEIWSGEIPVSF